MEGAGQEKINSIRSHAENSTGRKDYKPIIDIEKLNTITMSGDSIKHAKIGQALLVMSGKGGVGKSTVASQLAITFALKGHKVGLLDVDICGPSLARMLDREDGEIIQSENGWTPVKVRPNLELYLMSMSFLTNNRDSAIIWRGPKKHGMIERFITGVDWDQLDYLIVDTPPGTSDEHISLVELLRGNQVPIQAVLVTTPQIVACNDVRREISFCKTSGVPMAGLIENMNGYTCPHCSECTKIFSSSGGESLCKLANLNFLGSIPIDPNLCQCTENGKSFVEEYKDSPAAKLIGEIVSKIETRCD